MTTIELGEPIAEELPGQLHLDDQIDPPREGEGQGEVDPDAPYGRRPDGRPWTMSAQQRAEMGRRLAEGRLRSRQGSARRPPPAAPRRTGTSKAAPKSGPNYREAVLGLLQVPTFALHMLGRSQPVYLLDSAALMLHGPGLADAIATTAETDPRIAAVLDRILAVGPYGALLGALLPLALQIAANHRAIAPNAEMGILPPDQLMAAMQRQAGG